MAASSEDLQHLSGSVLANAYDDPDYKPNFHRVDKFPDLPLRNSFYLIALSPIKLVYVTETGQIDPIKITNLSNLKRALQELPRENSLRLSLTQLETIILKNTDYILQNEDTRARNFAMSLYAGQSYAEYEGVNSRSYFNQLKILEDCFIVHIVPFYLSDRPHLIGSYSDNFRDFFKKIKRENFQLKQNADLYNHLKIAIEFNVYVYAQRNKILHQGSFINLCTKVGNCPPGAATLFFENYADLRGIEKVGGVVEIARWLTRMRNTIFDKIIARFIIEKNTSDGYKLHLKPVFYQMSKSLKFNVANAASVGFEKLYDEHADLERLGIETHTID